MPSRRVTRRENSIWAPALARWVRENERFGYPEVLLAYAKAGI
jgi:hypothetical protein